MAPVVLVIEDEADILTYLMTVLEDHGIEARTVGPGESVVRAVSAVAPDLILLDVMMPGRSGVSIFKALRTSTESNDIPVVILSGFSSHGSRMSTDFRNLMTDESIRPPDGYIDKPVDRGELIDRVHGLTAGREGPSNG